MFTDVWEQPADPIFKDHTRPLKTNYNPAPSNIQEDLTSQVFGCFPVDNFNEFFRINKFILLEINLLLQCAG
jgi:hypothetical protein